MAGVHRRCRAVAAGGTRVRHRRPARWELRWRIPPWAPVDGEVLEIEPPRRLVTTEGTGILDGATQVTVTFESVEHGTRITVVHAGFGTGAGWQDQLEGHRHGWLRSLRDLVLYLETGVASRRFFSRWHCDLGMFLAESFAGLRVTEVSPGGWAAEAGVQAGDLVLYVDSLPIFERTDLWPFQIARRPGDRLSIDVVRNGSRVRGEARLRRIATVP